MKVILVLLTLAASVLGVFAQDDLPQSFSFNGITVSYPADWFAGEGSESQVIIANSPEGPEMGALPSGDPGPGKIHLSIAGPAYVFELIGLENADPETTLSAVAAASDRTLEVEPVMLGELPAATMLLVNTDDAGYTTLVWAVRVDDSTLLAESAHGEGAEELVPTVEAILATLQFDSLREMQSFGPSHTPAVDLEMSVAVAVGPNALISGVPVTGRITTEDPSDAWTYDGTADQTIRVSMVALSRGVLDPRLDISLPDGTQVASNDDSGNGEFGSLNAYIDLVQLPEDATYTITATCVGMCQGAYALLLEVVDLEGLEVLRQWAVRAEATSEYSRDQWSARQATGAPNTDGCRDAQTAWASSQGDSSAEELRLTYATPVIPRQVNVYQVYNPGSIVNIAVVDAETGARIDLPNSIDAAGNTPCPGVFTVDISDINRPVSGVVIYLDQSVLGTWNEIDAVELVGVAP
ncbi:MAG: hypothetical protein IPM16_19605 [Chloroflexi bacterium]|nr:hypothetical protein [Chloroflexota bacterium]